MRHSIDLWDPDLNEWYSFGSEMASVVVAGLCLLFIPLGLFQGIFPVWVAGVVALAILALNGLMFALHESRGRTSRQVSALRAFHQLPKGMRKNLGVKDKHVLAMSHDELREFKNNIEAYLRETQVVKPNPARTLDAQLADYNQTVREINQRAG